MWVDAVDYRPPYEDVLRDASTTLVGYEVVESLYTDYGDNQWSTPRDWPDGERSPGVLTVALLQQHPDLTYEEWVTRGHPYLTDHGADLSPAAATCAMPSIGGSPPVPHRSGALSRKRGPPSNT